MLSCMYVDIIAKNSLQISSTTYPAVCYDCTHYCVSKDRVVFRFSKTLYPSTVS